MNFFDFKIAFLTDPLSLFFLFIIAVVSLPAAVYSFGYLKGHYSPQKIRLNWVLFLLFIASMAMVVSVGNAFAFLISWEIMSLVSYFFVVFDTEQERSVRAGTIYMVMTHIGTAFITVGLLIMFSRARSFDFMALKLACQGMPPGLKNLVFIFLLIGFGTKAGIMPMHLWLPYAHPQAPSHISSLMSAVMIKTAVYGMLRYIVVILGIGQLWWGNLVLVLAVVSCLGGIMYALVDQNIKRLLAYSSVENMGIILLGVGAAILFSKMGLAVPAVLALAAGLYHLLNHAVFKALLFLAAGSAYKSTGTPDMEKMGGLIRVMPLTAVCFLVGAIAISALPPLNGFISEWLTLQAFFSGALAISGGMKVFICLCACGLALTGGLAAACFVKAFGITFLAMPRSREAEKAEEAALSMKLSMLFLALLCLVFGLAASPILRALVKVSADTLGTGLTGTDFTLNNFVLMPQPGSGAYLSNPLIALILVSAAALVFAGVYFGLGREKVTRANTWDCGNYDLTCRNEYTATAFSKPFRIAFSFFLKPYRKTEKIWDSFYHVRSFRYEVFTTPVFKRYIYDPVIYLTLKAATRLRRIQPGSIHLYIGYIFITVIVLVIVYGAVK